MKKQIISLLLAAAVTAGMTGCHREKTGSTMEIPLELSYAAAQLFTDARSPSPIHASDQWVVASEYVRGGKTQNILVYDVESGEILQPAAEGEAAPADGRARTCGWADTLEDGGLVLLWNEYKRTGNMDAVHYMDYYDAALHFVERVTLPAAFAEDTILQHHNYIVDSRGYSFVAQTDINGNSYFDVYDPDFEKQGEMLMPGISVQNLFLDAEGRANAVIWYYNEETFADSSHLYCLDGESLSYEQHSLYIPEQMEFAGGSGEYVFYYNNGEGIFGVKDDSTTEKVVDWLNSDFQKGTVNRIFALEDGRFLIEPYAGDSFNTEIWMLRTRTEEEIKNTKFISLAAVNLHADLQEAVFRFNRSSGDSRIVIKDYGEYNTPEDDSIGYDMLKEDMLDGIVADIICTDGLPFYSLAGKGLFEDLNTLLESDETFREEDYLMSFFDAMEYDGRLERIGFSYSVLTSAAKTEHVGEEQGISLAEFVAMEESLPDGRSLLAPMDKGILMYNFFHALQNCYIETDTMTCRFDSPEFVQLLELVNHIMQTDARVWDDAASFEAYWEVHPYPYRDDAALVSFFDISEPIHFHEQAVRDFGAGTEITLLGYPLANENGNGGLFSPAFTVSVNAQSKYQAEIWDFMKYLLSEEYQKKTGMPVLRSALEEKLENAQHMSAAEMGSATTEEMETLGAYLEGVTECFFYDETVYSIICEEVDMYLAGDCTAEEAAEMIQNRVSLYLSEQS